jgi:hypothetical protein
MVLQRRDELLVRQARLQCLGVEVGGDQYECVVVGGGQGPA